MTDHWFVYVVAPVLVALAGAFIKAVFAGVSTLTESFKEVNQHLTRMAVAQENTNHEIRDIKNEVKQVNHTAQVTAGIVAKHQDRIEQHNESIRELYSNSNDLRERVTRCESKHG